MQLIENKGKEPILIAEISAFSKNCISLLKTSRARLGSLSFTAHSDTTIRAVVQDVLT